VGGASGAGIGYIIANVPGAVAGGKFTLTTLMQALLGTDWEPCVMPRARALLRYSLGCKDLRKRKYYERWHSRF
jgi:hypothetical protein